MALPTVGRWLATCNLAGEPGSPLVRGFEAQVWWIPSAGVAVADVTGHPEVTAILRSVRVAPPATPSSTTGPEGGNGKSTAELAARCLLNSYLRDDATTASTCVGSTSKTLELFRQLDGYDRATLTDRR